TTAEVNHCQQQQARRKQKRKTPGQLLSYGRRDGLSGGRPRFEIRSLHDWRNKAIAALGYRLDEARVLGGIFEGLAQPVNRLVQAAIEIDKGVGAPQLLLQFLTGHRLSGSLEQHGQDLKGLILELDLEALLPQFAGLQ